MRPSRASSSVTSAASSFMRLSKSFGSAAGSKKHTVATSVPVSTTCFMISSRFPPTPPSLGRDRQQNDRSLNRLFPLRRQLQEDERWRDAGEQKHAGKHAPEVAAPAGDRD